MTTTTAGSVSVREAAAVSGRLLLAGALAGPLFFASAITQMLTREGFDITRHPISQLATGDLGWIQIATFVLAGAGVLALAAGIRRTLTEGIGPRPHEHPDRGERTGRLHLDDRPGGLAPACRLSCA